MKITAQRNPLLTSVFLYLVLFALFVVCCYVFSIHSVFATKSLPGPRNLTQSVTSAAYTTFTPTTMELENPERGFFFHLTGNEFCNGFAEEIRDGGVYNQKVRVIYYDIYPDNTTPEIVNTNLGCLRKAGLKAFIAFTYCSSLNCDEGYTISQMESQVASFKAVFEANRDVITASRIGLLGGWGEFASYRGNVPIPASVAARARDAILNVIPQEIPVVHSDGPRIFNWYGSFDPSIAWNGSPQSRVAYANDCFMSGSDDAFHFPGPVGTSVEDPAWTGTPAEQREYIHKITEYVPMEFETCERSSGLRLGGYSTVKDNAGNLGGIMREGPYYHATYGHRGYYTPFMDSWIADGTYREVANLLGYRFQLDSLTHPSSANRGDTVSVNVNLHNLGWARIYSARKLVVILKNRSTGEEISATSGELRRLPSQSTSPSSMVVNVPIPTTVSAGTYDVYLTVPDIYPTTKNMPAFSVRFANANNASAGQVWDPATARFKTGTALTISTTVNPNPTTVSTPTTILNPTPVTTTTVTPTPITTPTVTPTPVTSPTLVPTISSAPAGSMKNLRSGLCLTASPLANSTIVTQETCGTGSLPITEVANGVYTILKVTNTNWCIDIPSGQSANGTKAQLWSCDGSSDQLFTALTVGGGRTYTSASTNKCLDLGTSGARGHALQLWSCDSSLEQQFVTTSNSTLTPVATTTATPTVTPAPTPTPITTPTVTPTPVTSPTLVPTISSAPAGSMKNLRSGLCVTPAVSLVQITNGTPLLQVTCGANSLSLTESTNTAGTELRVTGTNWCVDVPNTAVNGTPTQLWKCDSSNDQRFTPIIHANGYRAWKSVSVGKCFDGGSLGTPGAVMKVWGCDNSSEQDYLLSSGTSGSLQSTASVSNPTPTPAPVATPIPTPNTSTGTMKNLRSGLCLAASPLANSTIVTQETCGTGSLPITEVASGVYTILKVTNTNWCIDIPSGQSANGTKAQLWSCDGSSDQLFTALTVGGGRTYTSASTNKCLDLGTSGTQGHAAQLWSCDGSLEQQFVTTGG